jgi:hypothetical protein
VRIDRHDPRDVEWELDRPAYRVHFWSQPGVPAGISDRSLGWTAAEFKITDADVHEVLAWASETAAGREFGVFVVVDHDDERGLIRLAGADPTRNP